MNAGLRRWLVPLLAALAVLAVVAVGAVVWTGTNGDGGSGDVGFGSAPSGGASSEPGSPGTGAPGDDLTPAPAPETPPGPHTQAVDGYFPRDARTLALNYTTGVPECYGKVGEPLVEETADAVTVTLPKLPPKSTRDVVCIDIALMKSVNVTLDAPLGDRAVRDGSRDGAKVSRADAPYDDGHGGPEPAY